MRFLETYVKNRMAIMKNEVQLNVTIDREIASDHRLASKLMDSTIEKVTEAALAFFYGANDAEILSLRKRAIAAASLLRRAKKPLKMVRGVGIEPTTPTVSRLENLEPAFA